MILIDGKKAAAELREELKKEVLELKSKYNKAPGLTVILIGDMAPSQIYVRMKEKAANEVGLKSEVIRYPDSVEEKTVLDKIDELNKEESVSGILVQLPLPKHIDKQKVTSKNFTKQIAFNVIPHIDSFMEDGSTKEEWKMAVETKKILDPNIVLSATCVRVPVFVGHSESVNIEFKSEVNAKKIRQCLEKAPGCKVVDETKDGGYITPVESSGDFVTYISRIRDDQTQKNSINMWVVSDNLLKGAALNAVQIANVLIKKYIS